ncbi:MAG: element excision factor XisH family protein [Caldilineaceae bacterium]
MAAKDLIHEPVRKALENDGWTVTDDPLTLRYRDKRVEIDLGAERWLIGAERANERIAVEVKSFLKPSVLRDLEEALGQYMVYISFLKRLNPERKLYIAVSDVAYTYFKESQAIQMLLSDNHIPLIVVNPETKEVIAWITN